MMDAVFRPQRVGGAYVFGSPRSVGVVTDPKPVMVGELSITFIGTSSFTVGWQAATDNGNVSGYEVSTDIGLPSYSLAGNTLSKDVAGLLPATTYTVRVRAIDNTGGKSDPLIATVVTEALEQATIVPVILKQSAGLVVEELIELSYIPCDFPYTLSTSQELVLFNKGTFPVTVTLRGDAAGIVPVKGAITKTLNLALGLPIVVLAGQFSTLRLDAASAFLKGDVTITAASDGVVFAGVLQ